MAARRLRNMLSFAPSIWLAPVGPEIIALDLAADRYFQLGPRLAQSVHAALAGDRAPATCSRLTQAGLARLTDLGRPFLPLATKPATCDGLAAHEGCVEQRLLANCLMSLGLARHRLRQKGFGGALWGAAERRPDGGLANIDAALPLARTFELARRWFPFERRCLPDGIALHALLKRRDVGATLVIGVSTCPFRAHCWVQSGDWLLTDCHDDIAELVPILAVE